MKAIALTRKPTIGNVANEIKELEIPVPQIKDNEILVEIKTSAMQIDDISHAQGTTLGRFFGPKIVSENKPFIMGTEFSGIIAEIWKNVSKWKIGDEVINITANTPEHGSWANFRCVNQNKVRLKPQELSHREAVSMIIPGCVAYGMAMYSKVKKGDMCLILWASWGIWGILTQILKAKWVIVTGLCSTHNIEKVKANGADFVIDYTKENFSEKLITQNIKMDLVFDSVWGKQLENQSIKILNEKGKFITVCGPEKYIGSIKLSWNKIYSMLWYILKRSIISKIIGPKYIFYGTVSSSVIDDMFDFVIKNEIKIPFDRVIPLRQKEMSEALFHLASHKTTGRIIIDMIQEEVLI